jgi:hypothetical protein
MATIDELMAAMNDHQVTDEDGQALEDTNESTPAVEEPQVEEEISEDEPAGEVNPADDSTDAPQAEEEEVEIEHAEDESGKRMIPEKRFKQIYAEKKAVERELESLRSKIGTPQPDTFQKQRQAIYGAGLDKADIIETEMLFDRHPEFDPASTKYSPILDEMGAEILKANPGISKLEAARRAKTRVELIAKQTNAVRTEARIVKQQVADSGMASRASRSDVQTAPNLDNMSDKEIEAYLRETGAWK